MRDKEVPEVNGAPDCQIGIPEAGQGDTPERKQLVENPSWGSFGTT